MKTSAGRLRLAGDNIMRKPKQPRQRDGTPPEVAAPQPGGEDAPATRMREQRESWHKAWAASPDAPPPIESAPHSVLPVVDDAPEWVKSSPWIVNREHMTEQIMHNVHGEIFDVRYYKPGQKPQQATRLEAEYEPDGKEFAAQRTHLDGSQPDKTITIAEYFQQKRKAGKASGESRRENVDIIAAIYAEPAIATLPRHKQPGAVHRALILRGITSLATGKPFTIEHVRKHRP